MELTELQAMWQQYDARLAENTRINKEILKRMLRSKPEGRLKWMKVRAIYGMVMPVPIMCIALIPNAKFRNEWDFYIGLILVIAMLAYVLYRVIQEFLLTWYIDFTNQVAKTRKQLIQLEGFRLRETKQGILSVMSVGIIGVCLLCQLPVMTLKFISLTVFIFLTAIVANYIHLKKFKNQINRFNAELDEIEQLEKE